MNPAPLVQCHDQALSTMATLNRISYEMHTSLPVHRGQTERLQLTVQDAIISMYRTRLDSYEYSYHVQHRTRARRNSSVIFNACSRFINRRRSLISTSTQNRPARLKKRKASFPKTGQPNKTKYLPNPTAQTLYSLDWGTNLKMKMLKEYFTRDT